MTDELLNPMKARRIYRLTNHMHGGPFTLNAQRATVAALETASKACKGEGNMERALGLLHGTSAALEVFTTEDPMIPSLRDALALAADYMEFRQAEQFDGALFREQHVKLAVQRAAYRRDQGEDHPVDFVSAPFLLGETYLTWEGKPVKITEVNSRPGYECVRGDDASENAPEGVWRYNRDGLVERGRVTGSAVNEPRNLIPRRLYAA